MNTTPNSAWLHVENLSFGYVRDRLVVDNLTFSLQPGEIGCLLGPSGCGKTSALRLVAGLEEPSQGRITLAGVTVNADGLHVPTERRGLGMVFQDYALFPHLDIAQNIAFGLRHLSTAERSARVAKMLAVVGLPGVDRLYPHQLSGGQRQRIALARALAPEPQILLLDEPFASLDQELRERLSLEVRAILKTLGATALMVTHDQHEAFAMADLVGVMAHGRLAQWDTAYHVYHKPATRFIADFVGQGVFLPGDVHGIDQIRTEFGDFEHCAGCDLRAGERVDVLLRPDDVQHDDSSSMQAEVIAKAFRGAEFLYTLKLPSGNTVLSLVPSHHDHAMGERIGIRLEVDHVIAFRTDGQGAVASRTSAAAPA
jgi:iron(III) transport system ATP-binding protein